MNKRAEKLLAVLKQELQFALEDSIVGERLCSSLSHQLKRTATSILYRHNVKQFQIQIQQQGAGFIVTVLIPPQGPIVETARLTIS